MDNPSRKVLADNLARLMRLGEPDQMTQALEGLAVSPRQPKNNFKKFLRLRAMRV